MPSSSLQRGRNRLPEPPLSSSPTPRVGTLNSLDELITEIARLQEKVIEELRQRRAWLRRELLQVDAELAELTWEPKTETPAPSTAPASITSGKRTVTLPELIAELEAAPDRTLNIRKATLEAKSIKALIKAHPQRLKLGGKGAWPTVTLLERAAGEPPRAKAEGSHPELFTFRDTTADGSE